MKLIMNRSIFFLLYRLSAIYPKKSCWNYSLINQKRTISLLQGRGGVACDNGDQCSSWTDSNYCPLCDQSFASWPMHALSSQHQARSSLMFYFNGSSVDKEVDNDKSANGASNRFYAVLSQLWAHLRIDFTAVDINNNTKITRRRNRIGSTVGYLRDMGVCHEGIAAIVRKESTRYDVRYHVSERFTDLVCLGQDYAVRETFSRVSRLLPTMPTDELINIIEFILQPHQLLRLFEVLQLYEYLAPLVILVDESDNIITKKRADYSKTNESFFITIESEAEQKDQMKLPPAAKISLLLASLGDLSSFIQRPRTHAIGHSLAADEYVLLILAQHAADTMISEIVHSVIQRVMDEGTAVADDYQRLRHNRCFDGLKNKNNDKQGANLCTTYPILDQQLKKNAKMNDPINWTLLFDSVLPLESPIRKELFNQEIEYSGYRYESAQPYCSFSRELSRVNWSTFLNTTVQEVEPSPSWGNGSKSSTGIQAVSKPGKQNAVPLSNKMIPSFAPMMPKLQIVGNKAL